MPSRIEDYALIGDCLTAALVGRDGSIDWLCLPRFDSPACFAGLLGGPEHGRWRVAPAGEVTACRRRYRGPTLILETEFETAEGCVRVVDFMPPRSEAADLVRIVEGVRGRVAMHLELVLRFDYGSIVPWVQRVEGGITATAGPDLARVISGPRLHGKDLTTVADFEVAEGERVPFTLTYSESYGPDPVRVDPEASLAETEEWWREWSSRSNYRGPWPEAVGRSLITLKALTYAPTGGIVAAPTTSLPEQLGGVRNWDYRICWVRDAAFTLHALVGAGYIDEAEAWRRWLQRAVGGTMETLQIMYAVDGRRRLDEGEIPWLPGYEGAAPVRVGNAASTQFQLDVYGELAATMYECRRAGLPGSESSWAVGKALYVSLETLWRQPDEGIWEVRGARRHFTHSKVMAWVAFDRAVKSIEEFGLDGPVDRWKATRDEIHAEVCREGYSEARGSFVQSYGSDALDASLLLIPIFGFLPADDPRVRSTIEAIGRELTVDGLVARYASVEGADGLPPGEGTFLPCSFWMVDCLHLLGRPDEARGLFERLVGLSNDVGLISEEYDPRAGRMTGNFPQAFTHVALINSAFLLAGHRGPDGLPGRAGPA